MGLLRPGRARPVVQDTAGAHCAEQASERHRSRLSGPHSARRHPTAACHVSQAGDRVDRLGDQPGADLLTVRLAESPSASPRCGHAGARLVHRVPDLPRRRRDRTPRAGCAHGTGLWRDGVVDGADHGVAAGGELVENGPGIVTVPEGLDIVPERVRGVPGPEEQQAARGEPQSLEQHGPEAVAQPRGGAPPGKREQHHRRQGANRPFRHGRTHRGTHRHRDQRGHQVHEHTHEKKRGSDGEQYAGHDRPLQHSSGKLTGE